MFCSNCGQSISEGIVYCPNCGSKLEEAAGTAPAQAAVPAPTGKPAYGQPHEPYAPAPYPQAPAARPKKKRGCLTALIVILIILAAAAAAVYFFVPGLFQPNDLGIRPSEGAYESAMVKLNIQKDRAPTEGDVEDYIISYGAPQKVEAHLTSEELTAFFNNNRPPYYAVKDVQVRINDDGTIEASGKLDTDYIFNQMLDGTYTREDAKKALPMLGLIPDTVNVYFKASGEVGNNQVYGLEISSAKVMGVPIPQSLIGPNLSFITDTLDSYAARASSKSGAYVDQVTIDDGQLYFKGSLPASIERVPAG